MRFFIAMLTLPLAATANPGVKKDTDIGKNKVKDFYQVTWSCEDGSGTCKIARVEEFVNPVKDENYTQYCTVVVRDNKRYSSCVTKKLEDLTSGTQTSPQVVDTESSFKENDSSLVDGDSSSNKNRLSLHAGYGPTGLSKSSDESSTTVRENMNLVLGVGYSRVVYKNFSLGVSIYTNKSVVGSVGVDF